MSTTLQRNLMCLTFLSLLWAWQGFLVLAFILRHLMPSSSLAVEVVPEWQESLKPQWQALIYHLALVIGILSQAALLFLHRSIIFNADLFKRYRAYLGIEACLTFLWTSAGFKMIVYSQRPVLAENVFLILGIAAIAVKVFLADWTLLLHQIWNFYQIKRQEQLMRRLLTWGAPLLIIFLLFIPNISAIVARNFIGEQFHHNDSFIMGPGWAYLQGQILDVDIISQYGIGFVVIISRLAAWMGGFTYEHVMTVMVLGTIAYYLAWYFLIRQWLVSITLSVAVMLWAIKWQMFHPGVFPFVFTYGSATPMRFFYDILYFWCIWRHVQFGDKYWLWLAGVACGFGIYYMTSEGMYATASFLAYNLLLWAIPSWRNFYRLQKRDLGVFVLPFVVALSLMFMTIGPSFLTQVFWHNVGEFITYFTSGFGLEPMYKTLLDHKYLESLIGFILPMAYLLSLMVSLTRLVLNRAGQEEWLLVVLCFYGLGTYHYYIARSTGTSYYVVILPLVFVLGFWLKKAISMFSINKQVGIRFLLIVISAWALLTNHLYLSYPNLFNLSSHPMTDPLVASGLPDGGPYFNHLFRNFNPSLKLSANSLGEKEEDLKAESDFLDDNALVDYYHNNSRFDVDAKLISSLTAKSQEVPLISSFETELLMQAKRKTFFYYFPLIISRPMKMRSFEVCSLYTKEQLAKTIAKFEREKPPYVFMERIFMVNEVPRVFLFEYPSLIPLINYVRTTYTPFAQGEYLIALKRKV